MPCLQLGMVLYSTVEWNQGSTLDLVSIKWGTVRLKGAAGELWDFSQDTAHENSTLVSIQTSTPVLSPPYVCTSLPSSRLPVSQVWSSTCLVAGLRVRSDSSVFFSVTKMGSEVDRIKHCHHPHPPSELDTLHHADSRSQSSQAKAKNMLHCIETGR